VIPKKAESVEIILNHQNLGVLKMTILQSRERISNGA